MLTGFLFVLGSVAVGAEAAAAELVVIENEHLAVTFEQSEAGPRLASVVDRATRETYAFENAEEVALAVVPPEAVSNPKTRVTYRLQDGYRFEGFSVGEGQDTVTLRFAGDLVDVAVTYRLQSDAAVLRKETVCTANERGAYVAGVTLWIVKPTDLSLAWPKNKGSGQLAVLLADRGGCFVTLEWPQARIAMIEGDIRIAYRPGHLLEAGETRQVAAGSMGFFSTADTSEEEKLEAARKAFFKHVADRVKPDIPFPVKFTTWGPWLGQMRQDRIMRVLDDLEYVGVDLLHLDAGWQEPDHPYSRRLPKVRGADDEAWDREMIQHERLPDGLLPIARAAKERGLKISLWFDACGNVFVREDERWAVRDREGHAVQSGMWEQRWPKLPRQSLASPYGELLEEFVIEMMDRYDLGGIMFDNNAYTPDFAGGRRSLANGWNSTDVQLGTILDILDEGERRRPGIYRFYCRGVSWPWALLHATHIHAGDPGMSKTMQAAVATDHPARALAFERRLAWQRHYDNFVPPWGIKGDIAGWSVQQRSPIPINLKHTGLLIPTGEGWTQNMFTCFATTAVRDVRFSFRQMPQFDREILKQWLAWDRRRSRFVLNCRPFLRPGSDPNQGIVGYSHVGDGRGVIYLFNNSFDGSVAEVTLDEGLGLRPQDEGLSAYLVYPVNAPLGSGKLSFGQTLRIPIIGKDCVVIEVGLEPPEEQVGYDEYEKLAASVRRSYRTVFLTSADRLFDAAGQGPVRLEIGDGPRDRRLAVQIIETLGAATGKRLVLEDCLAVPAAEAGCRLIVGSHDGLTGDGRIGDAFCETLYDRYVRWDGRLYSAPLCAAMPGDGPATFCLLGPRPEQLARLANDLTSELLKEQQATATPDPAGPGPQRTFSFEVDLPREQPLLRFLPVIRQHGHMPVPGDLEMVRFRIEIERGGKRSLLWQEDIPPFASPGHGPDPDSFDGTQWWEDRVVSVADFAGDAVKLHFTADHIDGRGHPQVAIGFSRVAFFEIAAQSSERPR